MELADVGVLHCKECDDEITVDDVQAIIDVWRAIMAWLATAPTRRE